MVMNLRKTPMAGRMLRKALVLAVVTPLAACGSISSFTGGEDDVAQEATAPLPGNIALVAQNSNTPTAGAQIDCPPVQALADTNLITKYARGGQDNPSALLYQASISQNAASCRFNGEQVALKLGVAGRTTPGPQWKGGEILLPLRVAVVSTSGAEEQTVFSKLFTIPVTVGVGSPSAPWVFVEEDILIPNQRDLKILYGFDDK